MTEAYTEQAPGHSESDAAELARTVRIMDKLHATEVFGTPEKSKEFLDSLNYDEFKKYISLVNGVERAIPATERGKVSGSHIQAESALFGTSVAYRPPDKSIRDPLLEQAFKKAQSIDSPEVAGLTLGMSINAIHYFNDGNGRTARMVNALLTKGYDGSPEHQEYYSALLENTKGRDIINPNPEVSGLDVAIRSEMAEQIRTKAGYDELLGDGNLSQVRNAYPDSFAGEESREDLAVSDDIDAAGREMLFRTLESGGMATMSLMAAFKPERVKDFIGVFTNGNRFVDGEAFLPTLSKEEIVEWWHMSERALRGYVQRVINFSDRDDAEKIIESYR